MSLVLYILVYYQTIAAPRKSGGESPSPQLAELANTLLSGIVDNIKSALTQLKRF